MPGLTHPQDEFINYDNASNNHNVVVNSTTIGFWSKHRGDISSNQLQKFWNDLSPQARQELLRIDKQALFEQARKNMYCSRCNGLLLEGFLQIVMYGKSLQQEGHVAHVPPSALKNQNYPVPATTNGSLNDTQDPSVHPWGGLTTTRDSMLTLLDCYLYSKSLKGLYNVFDSARARERERELLYPDACGGGARGWISQGIVSYGRGHGTRETCALHTARLSCDTLVDFWSALGDETRQSLLRMKEEDFIERLMYRFDSKRFCRDCRRNVIREFKELKELKRIRKEPRCTSSFCVADTAFQYQVSNDRVQADWHQTFTDAVGTYHQFEWAIGTGEGKSDILEFENVGMNRSFQVNGLNLAGISACYITLRAWKLDGRCSELSVKAHALKGRQCVHGRLVVGDGYVTIARGESIRRFFEHAEEVEEEEDDDSMDKDGNELDGECSRPQKHAKSPELAREFLLDAATVIFKEQVEKAFREGTARQNAHSIFVCLALKLLEERVHVACKEIVTLEKQMKLLEEEEKEKREEEERKERRKVKEREKKLRRKERLKGKERDKEKVCFDSNEISDPLGVSKKESSSIDEDPSNNRVGRGDSMSETGDIVLSMPLSSDVQDELCSDWHSRSEQNHSVADEEDVTVQDGNGSFTVQNSRFSQLQHKFWKASQKDAASKWSDKHRFVSVSETVMEANKSEPKSHKDNFGTYSPARQLKSNSARSNLRTMPSKYGEKFHSSKKSERFEFHSCSCSTGHEYRAQAEPNTSAIRSDQDAKDVNKCCSSSDSSKLFRHHTKFNQLDYMCDNRGRSKSRTNLGNNTSSKDSTRTKKVWEPTQSRKYPRSNSESDLTIGSSSVKIEGTEIANLHSSCVTEFCGQMIDDFQSLIVPKVTYSQVDQGGLSGCDSDLISPRCSLITADKKLCSARSSPSNRRSELIVSSASTSDNCSVCLSEGDSNTATSNPHNHESSSTSDSEDASQQSEGRETSDLVANVFSENQQQGIVRKQTYDEADTLRSNGLTGAPEADSGRHKPEGSLLTKGYVDNANGKPKVNEGSQHQAVHSSLDSHNMRFSSFQAPTMGYYQQNAIRWPVAPANGLMAFSHPNHYLFSSPFGCGLNDSGYYMQYGGLPHVASPFLNPTQVPVFHPVAVANGVISEDKLSTPETSQAQGYSDEASKVRGLSAKSKPTETPHSNGVDEKDRDPVKMVGANNGFSLFHFGGPVALSTSLKEGTIENFSSNNSAVHVEMDHAYSKKDTTIEEYNLFKTSNGLRFSFF